MIIATRKLFLLLALLATACVYRQDIPQGNFFTTEDAAKLAPGMTREQVQFVMGTPMIRDPFHPHRWDYVFYVDSQYEVRERYQRVTVFFTGDTVERIVTEGLDDADAPTPSGSEGITLEGDGILTEE